MSKRKFGIYIPSYKRAATISTHRLLEYYKVVVRNSEETEYLKAIPKENLIAVPDEEINNIVKVVNWIVDNSEEDVIAMIDDDMRPGGHHIGTREDCSVNGGPRYRIRSGGRIHCTVELCTGVHIRRYIRRIEMVQ